MDDPRHVCVLARRLDDGDDGGDAYVPHGHVYDYGDPRRDGHIREQMRSLVLGPMFRSNSMKYLETCSLSLSALLSNSVTCDRN